MNVIYINMMVNGQHVDLEVQVTDEVQRFCSIKKRGDPARIAMRNFHAGLCAVGYGVLNEL